MRALWNIQSMRFGGGMTGKINIALIEKFILLLLCLKYRNRLSENKSFNLFLNIFVLSIICYYSFFQMYIFQQRLVFIFQLSTIGIWVLLLRSSTKETQKWLTLALNILVVYFFLHYLAIWRAAARIFNKACWIC